MKLTVIKNPFDESSRFIKDVIPDKPVFDLVEPFLPDCKYNIILDGHTISDEEAKTLVPTEKQTLGIVALISSGGGDSGKDTGRIIASIVLAVVAGWAGGAVAKIYGIQAGILTSMGVSIIGGYLMQLWFGTESEETKKTYEWGNISANDREGGAVQMTYGEIKVGANGQAQIISQYVRYEGSKQYLNILLCGGEGPCDYVNTGMDNDCTGITNIKINDNDISNYSGVTVYKRSGLNNQTKIPNFDDSYDVKSLSYELEEGAEWKTDQTNGAAAGLEFVFSFVTGLGHTNKKGRLVTTWVTLQIQYKLTTSETWLFLNDLRTDAATKYTGNSSNYEIYLDGDFSSIYPAGTPIYMIVGSSKTLTTVSSCVFHVSGGGEDPYVYWTILTVPVSVPSGLSSIQREIDYHTIYGRQNEPLYVVKRLDNVVTEGQYDVRTRCTEKEDDSTSYANAVYWTSIAGIIYDDFTRPNKILLAIEALATDQFSGSATITWNQTRSKVWVWVPDDETVPWGSGSYQQKNANNPAWACYDIMHGCYKLYNINTSAYEYVIKRIPADKFLYADFKKWADLCDAYNITCAYFINETQTLWDSLKPLETIGRGKVCPFGTKIGVMCNFPDETITQRFNYSNIILESFQGEFIGQSERANALEVSFLNADRDFKRQYFPAYSDNYDEALTVNPTSIFLQACSSLSVAWRYAQFQLRMNKYLYRTAKWQCGVDSIHCRLGDVVAVTTPKWGAAGRIVNVGDNWIEIDKTIDAFGEVINGIERQPGIVYFVRITLSDDTVLIKNVSELKSCAIFGRAAYTLGSEDGPATGTRIYFTEAFTNDRAAATYLNATTFTVIGDLTANFPEGKTDLILYAGNEDIYPATIVSSIYADGVTTVVCDNVPTDIYDARWAFTKPEQYNLYSFGTENAGYKLFRLTQIERHDDLTATLTGLEYITEVYEDNTVVPEIESGADTGTVTVNVNSHLDSATNLYLDISWFPSRKIYFGAIITVDDIQIAKVDVSTNSYSYVIASTGTYVIKVTSLDYFGNPFASGTVSYEATLNDPPPQLTDLVFTSAVKGFTISFN